MNVWHRVTTVVMVAVGCMFPIAVSRSAETRDVTMRVTYKWVGGLTLTRCDVPPDDWGWDSLTWRFPPGDTTGQWHADVPQFTVDRVLSSRAAWVTFHGVTVSDSVINSNGFVVPKTMFVTTEWSQTLATEGIMDAGGWCRIRVVAPPEPLPVSAQTIRLKGRVEDDSTGCAIAGCRVFVSGTSVRAYADRLGRFGFELPAGNVRLHACAHGYAVKDADVQIPCDTLVLRLRSEPRAGRVIEKGPCY